MQNHLKSIHFVKQCKKYSVTRHRKRKYFKLYTEVDWHFYVCYNHIFFINRLTTTAMSPTKASDITVGDDDQKKHTDDWWACSEPCALPKHVQEVALIQLRENESVRNQAISAFRQWILKNADIQNVNTDENFLLRFLRTKKFSLPMAQQMLLKYLNLRQRFSMYFMGLDCLIPSINELIDSGYMFVSPFRDNQGRRVIIGTARGFDLRKYSNRDLGVVHVMTYETLLNDEVNQVMGFTHFGDLYSITPAYITLFAPNEFATLIKWGEQSIPMRHKAIHLLNVPSPIKFAYDYFQSRISPKLSARMKMYNSLSELHETLDKKVLPKEYGGEMPMAEMISLWKKELLANREKLIALDNMRLLSDKSIITRKSKADINHNLIAGFNQLSGSFRKLEVD
ncbi:clavesin-2 isoform X1 [Acyrthosiphon pisum]|uniref:CRAL-TRIO domain-containing protein n=2 Tax=Acyrthosiphon pisum TaxID=7029 RepID=A0A8R2B5F5_ACYPI|nr:clavesin-2 isoform X1 [Acyrthosiphon pisum]